MTEIEELQNLLEAYKELTLGLSSKNFPLIAKAQSKIQSYNTLHQTTISERKNKLNQLQTQIRDVQKGMMELEQLIGY